MASDPTEATNTNKSNTKGVFHRLVRSMSGRNLALDNATASPPQVATAGTESGSSQGALQRSQSTTSLSYQSNETRLSVGERLKQLGRDLPLNLLRRNSKSEPASPRVTGGEIVSAVGNSHDITSAVGVGHMKVLSMVDETAEGSYVPQNPSSSGPNNDTAVSLATLAQQLRDLIDPLPFPSFRTPVKEPKLSPRDKKGRPIPPPSASPIKDSKLIALLSSATFMNGSGSGNKPRPSVWELLEGLGVPPHGFPEQQSEDQPEDGGGNSPDDPNNGEPDFFKGTASVMVYSPLIPGREDIVELGELVPISVEQEILQDVAASNSWISIWPLSWLPGWTQFTTQTAVREAPLGHGLSADFIVHSDVTTVDVSGRRLRVKTTSAWVPSTTKMSFQAMWWGYRLWLPPPVMAILSDKSLEAAKRASLIATALAWFFNNLPIDLFPPQARPALLLMQRIVPYLGYIATFISWSWGTIKSYDVGHGITLTTTWLLPIALIPGTWFEKDVPKSPPQSPPVDIPKSPAPTSPPALPQPTTPAQPPVDTPKTPPSTSPPSTDPTPSPQPTEPAQPPSQPAQPTQPTPQSPETVPQPSLPVKQQPPQIPSLPEPGSPSDQPTSGQDPIMSPIAVPVSSKALLAKKLLLLSPAKRVIPASPVSAGLSPITPIPIPRTPVQIGSTLGEELLQAPVLRPVPLPEDSCEALVAPAKSKEKRRAKALFLIGR